MVQARRQQWWHCWCFWLLLLRDGSSLVAVRTRSHAPNSSESTDGRFSRRVATRADSVTDSNSNQPTVETVSTTSHEEDETNYRLRFGGVARLLASQSSHPSVDTVDTMLQRLQRATVVVIGLGGVGSWAAEALARSGIGRLVLIDLDDICISNTNRQSHALDTTVGQLKIDAVRERVRHIHPTCRVVLIHDFVTPDTIHGIFQQIPHSPAADDDSLPMIVLDAIDGARDKAALLSYCDSFQIPVVTCGGAAGRSDPTLVRTTDLTLVDGDKLLASCKKELRKHHGFQPGLSFRERQKGRRVPKWNIDCVYSEESVATLDNSTATSSFRLCDGALGTACFLTGTFGFAAAAAVVNKVAHHKLTAPKGRR